MKLGFIGAGNMAGAIVDGIISSGFMPGNEIAMFDPDSAKVKAYSEKYGVMPMNSNEELIENCSAVVLAVKPVAFPALLPQLTGSFKRYSPLVISIAAGKTIETIHELIGCDLPIIRVMPNINALAGEAISAYTGNDLVTEENLTFVAHILNATGRGVQIDEALFSAFSAVASCSPAYIYLFVDTIARVGVKFGLYKEKSLKLVSETAAETAEQWFQKGVPNLEKNASEYKCFEKSVKKAIESALNKDRSM